MRMGGGFAEKIGRVVLQSEQERKLGSVRQSLECFVDSADVFAGQRLDFKGDKRTILG
jgi:hypothetical protein